MTEFTKLKLKISPDVHSQEVGGETVLLDLQSESYFGLDEVGTRVWQLLRENEDMQSVYEAILTEYDVEEVQLRKDLEELMEKLVEAGLVSIEDCQKDHKV